MPHVLLSTMKKLRLGEATAQVTELVISGSKVPSHHTYSPLTVLWDPYESAKVHFSAPIGTAHLSLYKYSQIHDGSNIR